MKKLRLLGDLENLAVYNLIDSLISKKKLKGNLSNLIST